VVNRPLLLIEQMESLRSGWHGSAGTGKRCIQGSSESHIGKGDRSLGARGKNISWGIGLSMKYYWNTENVTTGEIGESHFPYSTLRGAVRGVRRYIKGEGGGPWIYSIFDRPYWSEDLPGPVGFTSEPVRSGIEDFR